MRLSFVRALAALVALVPIHLTAIAALLLTALVPIPTALLSAQIVPIRTVPVASGDQFLVLPAANLGMAGVHFALNDSLADPWANPAKGVFIDESSFLGSPTFYGISNNGGSGKTFPVAGLFHGVDWFGGASLALQQVNNSSDRRFSLDQQVQWIGRQRRLSDVSARNLYASGFLGRQIGAGPWSIGLAASASHLDAVDGVDLLYAGADRIEQSGRASDLRLGLYRDGARERLAIVLVNSRISMTHDVTYIDFNWDDPMEPPTAQARIEINEDETRTWGGQLSWDRDLTAPGWRVGAAATVNKKSHAKIPNYSIQNIPRDPGTTWAYEVGFGFGRTRGPTTFGIDVAVQPIWSETWQEADKDVMTNDSLLIEAGGKTIENEFFFTNVILRAGLSHQLEDIGLQGGLEVRSYDYTLEQTNHLESSFRDQDESWMEWTPTFGATFRFSDLKLSYAGRLTTGTGRPGTSREFRAEGDATLSGPADFIVAPEAPLTLQDASVLTHQLTLRIPIR